MAGPAIGEPAPAIELPWTGEGELRLADMQGSWVVLAFYPGDFTSVCTRQFCSYRDDGQQLERLDAVLVGISPQDIDSHTRFTTEHGLNVPLAADVDKEVAGAYGVLGPGGYVRRAIFIVDPEGIIRHRKVSLVGLGYEDASDLGEALAEARASIGS